MTSKRIDWTAVTPVVGTLYPPPFDEPCLTRQRRKLGDAAGLTQFGVNLLVLPPGAWSSQRHWHTAQDEFIHVLSGEVTLVTDSGAEVLRAGDSAGFKAGDSNGHCLQNRSSVEARVLEIGTRSSADEASYSDIDLHSPPDGKPAIYTRRDGTPYENLKRRSG
ncbi:MAG: cupin domain-containing protein [Reyranellaceae bacterium]